MVYMFFRRERPKPRSFQDKVNMLQGAGFTASKSPSGSTRIVRGPYALDLIEKAGEVHVEDRAGILTGDEIGVLVDGGYQKFFLTPSGKKRPALAHDLEGLHAFEEDVKESLGMESLYNESLGTRSALYLYDRVKDRDGGVPKRVWE
jgi:hypothetical protein